MKINISLIFLLISYLLISCQVNDVNKLVIKFGKKYYYDGAGKRVKNVYVKYNDKEYYFNDKGEVIVNSWTIDGNKYADENGEIVKYRLYEINGEIYYFDAKGNKSNSTQWLYIDDDYVYLENGVVTNKGWKEIDKKWYYFDKNGAYLRSQWIDNYYVNSKGEMCQNTMENIDGKDYYFDANGKCIKNYSQIINYINIFIYYLTKGGKQTYSLDYLDIVSSSNNDIRFLYIIGTDKFTSGIKNYYEDYVKGNVIDNSFVRDIYPIYDSLDNSYIAKLNDWMTMAALYKDKCNTLISMENYIGGNRNGNLGSLYFVSEDAIPLTKNITKKEYPEMFNIITSRFPQSRMVANEQGCREIIEMKNLAKIYGFSKFK